LGIGFDKPPEPADQPFGGKIRRHTDGDHPRALALQQAIGAERDPVERVPHHGQVAVASFGNGQTLALAVEQLHAEFGLQSLHLMADGTLGDAQLVGGSGEALVPRCGLK
jgi:hypothetical protein